MVEVCRHCKHQVKDTDKNVKSIAMCIVLSSDIYRGPRPKKHDWFLSASWDAIFEFYTLWFVLELGLNFGHFRIQI